MSTNVDQYSKSRNERNGRCPTCGLSNTNPSWCQTCDPQKLTEGWSSGDKGIDKFIQETQLMAVAYNERYLEWIPYYHLNNFTTIFESGLKTIKAVWATGERKVLQTLDGYVRTRSKPVDVVVRSFAKNHEALTPENFKHLKIHYSCQIKIPDHVIHLYGLTQNPDTKEVFMVTKFASHGDLGTYLRSSYRNLKWTEKLDVLFKASEGLSLIHKNNYMHRNFHSGNILQSVEDNNSKNVNLLIKDFSLATKVNEHIPSETLLGVLPYISPEMLCGKKFTTLSDVYSLGIIMTELSSGKIPYDDRSYDADLALDIVTKGLRPVFREATPQIFIDLAIDCLKPIPEERPTAETIASTVRKWKTELDGKEDSSIKESFLYSDRLLKTHENQIIENKVLDSPTIRSKTFEFKNLPDHSSCKPPRTRIVRSDSKQVNLVIPEFPADK